MAGGTAIAGGTLEIPKRLKKERQSALPEHDSAPAKECKFRAEGNLTRPIRVVWSSYHRLATVGDFPVPPAAFRRGRCHKSAVAMF
ncbi:hypothetical protein ACTGJ9_008530 [Bradyrhizobium sp. RDM12]